MKKVRGYEEHIYEVTFLEYIKKVNDLMNNYEFEENKALNELFHKGKLNIVNASTILRRNIHIEQKRIIIIDRNTFDNTESRFYYEIKE